MARRDPAAAYRGGVFPSTGSPTLDRVLDVGSALALAVWLVLLVRRYRGR